MSILGHPDTDKAVRVFDKTVKGMDINTLIFNYIILDVDFKFTKNTKYPCIPTRVDNNVDIYQVEGTSTITGVEYLVAKSMGCRLYVKDGILIPFKTSFKKSNKYNKSLISNGTDKYLAPFCNIIKELQNKRRSYPKKTFFNYLYKEIGNSIYGQVAMGISGKKSFDVRTNQHLSVEGSELSNPILASYITGFTRALVSECMSNIQALNGNIVSVTTDGFITDISNLEEKLMGLNNNNINLLKVYRSLRKKLTYTKTEFEVVSDERALEVKNVESVGLAS
jgi:hypothetical protein